MRSGGIWSRDLIVMSMVDENDRMWWMGRIEVLPSELMPHVQGSGITALFLQRHETQSSFLIYDGEAMHFCIRLKLLHVPEIDIVFRN